MSRKLVWAVLLAALSAATATAGPSPVNLSRSATESTNPALAIDGALVVAAWIESESLQDGVRSTIVTARSTDGGREFSPAAVIAELTGNATALDLKYASGVVHVVWLASQFTGGDPTGVDYARSTDGGVTFEPVRLLNESLPAGAPSLAGVGDSVAVVWSARGAVYAATSFDGGASYAGPVAHQLSEGDVVDGSARAAAGVDSAYGFWVERRGSGSAVVLRTVSSVTGLPEAAPADVAASDGAMSGLAVAATSTVLAVVWSEPRDGARVLTGAWSANGILDFTLFGVIGEAGALAAPRMVVVSGVLHGAFIGARSRLTYFRLATGTAAPVIVRRLGKNVAFATIAASETEVVVAWVSGAGRDAALHYAVGETGRGPRKVRTLSPAGETAFGPFVAIDGERVGVAWHEPVRGARDVFYTSLR